MIEAIQEWVNKEKKKETWMMISQKVVSENCEIIRDVDDR